MEFLKFLATLDMSSQKFAIEACTAGHVSPEERIPMLHKEARIRKGLLRISEEANRLIAQMPHLFPVERSKL